MHEVYLQRDKHLAIIPAHSPNIKEEDFEQAFNLLVHAYTCRFGHAPTWRSYTVEEDLSREASYDIEGPFLIWNRNANLPTKPHFNKKSLYHEAERLAKKHPGEPFLLMAPFKICQGQQQSVIVHWEG